MLLQFFTDAKRRVVVGDECAINVDKSMAGPGNVTARIGSPTGQPTDITIEDNKDGTVSIYYTPRHPGMTMSYAYALLLHRFIGRGRKQF